MKQPSFNMAEQNVKLSPQLNQLKEQMGEDLKQWVTWMKSWPLYIEEKDFLVVHAGLEPYKHPKQTAARTLLHIRTWDGKGEELNSPHHPPWYDFYKGEKLVLYGHWALQGLKIRKNTIGLDSGCVYGKNLSGILLPERKILQVSSKRASCSF